MGKNEKLLHRCSAPEREELCRLLAALEFAERTKGGHRIFFREGVEEILNLQPRPDGHAKPYQVKQVRQVITRYRLGFD